MKISDKVTALYFEHEKDIAEKYKEAQKMQKELCKKQQHYSKNKSKENQAMVIFKDYIKEQRFEYGQVETIEQKTFQLQNNIQRPSKYLCEICGNEYEEKEMVVYTVTTGLGKCKRCMIPKYPHK